MNTNDAKKLISLLKSGKSCDYSVMYDGIRVVYEFSEKDDLFYKKISHAYEDGRVDTEEFSTKEFITYIKRYDYEEILESIH